MGAFAILRGSIINRRPSATGSAHWWRHSESKAKQGESMPHAPYAEPDYGKEIVDLAGTTITVDSNSVVWLGGINALEVMITGAQLMPIL